MLCLSCGLKLTWNVTVTAPQWNLTLSWPDFHFNAEWDHRSPKPQLRRSVSQIFLNTVASSNQQLHIFSRFFLIVLIMPRPIPIGIRHVVAALAHGGMWQSAIAGRMGLTHATVNHILWKHAATGILVTGKSKETPWKTTPRQDHALLRMVRQDPFISARVLTAWMRNLYGMRASWTTINNRLLSCDNHAYKPTRKPLLTANHCCLRLEWAQRWRNLTMANWQQVIFSGESRFQHHTVDGRLRVRRLPGEHFQQKCQAYRVQAGGGLVHLWGAFSQWC